MSMTEAEDTNAAEQTTEDTNAGEPTPDEPCHVCDAVHDEETGTVVGRLDRDSDIPLALPDPTELPDDVEDPFELSFCNDCIEDYLLGVQNHIKVLRPRQAQAASYMLLGLELRETLEMVNAREAGDGLKKSTVRDYRGQARQNLREALQVGLGGSPILKEVQRN